MKRTVNDRLFRLFRVSAMPALGLLLTACPVVAAQQSFDFKDPKGVNNVVFKLDAPLESINGSASGVSGTVTYDPADPGATKGKITVATSSLHVGNSMMQGHLLGEKWLNASKYPEISFEVKEVKNARITGDVTTADVSGVFSLHGESKEMTIPVKFTYLKDKLGARIPGVTGDLLVLRANFSLKRSDFGIQAGQNEDKVSNDIELVLAVAGGAPR
jgi:polyisoprenoid-binding protein YceI